MNWGKWIIVSFILFAAFIGVLVTVCMREDISLVSKNYYQDELAYEKQIQRINNTYQLKEKPTVIIDKHTLKIRFNQFSNMEHGLIKLFRPSDSKFDKQFVLQSTNSNEQQFDLAALPKGMYRAKMQWSMKNKDYYFEKVINL